MLGPRYKRRAALPDGIDNVNEFAFHRAHSGVVVLAFADFLVKVCFEFRIAPSGNEGGIEEQVSELPIASLRKVAFAFDRCATFLDAAIETDVGYEFFRRRKTVDATDVRDDGCGNERSNAGYRPQEVLCVGFVFSELPFDGTNLFGKGGLHSGKIVGERRRECALFCDSGFMPVFHGRAHPDESRRSTISALRASVPSVST